MPLRTLSAINRAFGAVRGKRRRWALSALGGAVWLLTACQTAPQAASPQANPTDREVRPVATASAQAIRYEIDAARSDVRLLVFRAGALARLGHNHVVQARNIRGEIQAAPDPRQSTFSVDIPVADLRVDDESARCDEGEDFASRPDADAVAATTRNMLGAGVLDALRYPVIEIRSTRLTGPIWGMDAGIRIKLHGVARELVVPIAVTQSGDTLVATAFFSIAQTDFGIAPMSLFGGGLRVDDSVRVRMRIVAARRDG